MVTVDFVVGLNGEKAKLTYTAEWNILLQVRTTYGHSSHLFHVMEEIVESTLEA
jgi:hypothetical protein